MEVCVFNKKVATSHEERRVEARSKTSWSCVLKFSSGTDTGLFPLKT
jgi:hypothetical protein